MIRLTSFLLIVFIVVAAKEDINKKIKLTSTELKTFSNTQSQINAKMAQNARAVLKLEKDIGVQEKHLVELEKELGEKESSYKENTTQLQDLKTEHKILQDAQDKIEQELVFTIAQSVSLSVVLEEKNTANEESIIELEVLKNMLKSSKEKAKTLNEKFYDNAKNITSVKNHTTSIEKEIADIDSKRKDLLKTQKANKSSLAKLKSAKKEYKKELKAVLNKQDILKKTLEKLNIIKVDEIKRAQEDKERKAAFKGQVYVDDSNLPTVKKHGSSYQQVKTIKYEGVKTIAPLDDYTITKEYGTYTDPIYKIKIFNESVSLKPKQPNAKVKTVFNGKVIYADKTAVLDNIVIVEHTNGMHTIYANLSQISPNIKQGKKIKKGYTIGRVSDELVFEVTQKTFHINPIRLFE